MAGRVDHHHGRAPRLPDPAGGRGRGGELTGRGRLVALEGGEGSGKSTQAALLAEALGAVLTREPGGTAVGRAIRHILLGPDLSEVDERAEALLLAADRAQHVAEVVLPALEQGRNVVTDRFSGSTLAYQGWGRGLDTGWLSQLSAWASRGVEPDLFVLLDVDSEVAQARRCGSGDRMERAGEAFHRRVLEGYRSLAHAEPQQWVVVEGSGAIEVVAAAVREAVMARLAPVP